MATTPTTHYTEPLDRLYTQETLAQGLGCTEGPPVESWAQGCMQAMLAQGWECTAGPKRQAQAQAHWALRLLAWQVALRQLRV